MPKALAASCVAGVVTIDGVAIPGAVLLSEGVSASTGYAIIDEDKIYYVAKTSPDLKTAITTINSMVTKVSSILSSIDGSLSGSNASAIATLVAQNTAFGLTKDILK